MAGQLTLNGTTSGAITLTAPSVAGTNTLTLPATTGTLLVQLAGGGIELNGSSSGTLTLQAQPVASGTVTFPNGPVSVGYINAPQNSQTTSYVTVLSDSGKQIYMNGSSLTVTINANASVAYDIGTVLTFINGNASNLSIAIAGTDIMTLANSTTTGTRTLAQNGIASAIKVGPTAWLINGNGLT